MKMLGIFYGLLAGSLVTGLVIVAFKSYSRRTEQRERARHQNEVVLQPDRPKVILNAHVAMPANPDGWEDIPTSAPTFTQSGSGSFRR